MSSTRLTWLILFFIGLIPQRSFPQAATDHWYFGGNAGLTFRSGGPEILANGKLNTDEGVAVVSDAGGQLLFYTDGKVIWNGVHQVMSNGTGLMGHESSSQSAVIVPQPGNDSIYFVFTVDAQGGTNGLRYSAINVHADHHHGTVISKNTPLLTPTTEKITSVKHCNGKDIWVVTRGWRNDLYYAFLVTRNGVNPVPVTSATGNIISGYPENTIGYLKASPDGKLLAAANWGYPNIELTDFNDRTGIVTNLRKIDCRPFYPSFDFDGFAYGVEFSPNGKYLYSSSVHSSNLWTYYAINQYSLSSGDESAIRASLITLDTNRVDGNYAALQLASDGKIYVAKANGRPYLCTIDDPNAGGIAATFRRNSVFLGSGRSNYGLPSFIQSYFTDTDFQAQGNCEGTTVKFFYNQEGIADSVKWNFGDFASQADNSQKGDTVSHTFTATGTFTVQAIVYKKDPAVCAQATDTLIKVIAVGNNVNLGEDTTICTGDTIALRAGMSYANLIWSNGSSDSSVRVHESGDYWLHANIGNCLSEDTIQVNAHSPESFDLGRDTTVCQPVSLKLQPSVSVPGEYLWSSGAAETDLTIDTPGTYWLRVTDTYGCYHTDSIEIFAASIAPLSVGVDTVICEGASVTLTTNVAADTYIWNTGAHARSIVAKTPGMYVLQVMMGGCEIRDSIAVTSRAKPMVSLGNDTAMREGQVLELRATGDADAYRWSNGAYGSALRVSAPGEYVIEGTKGGCSARDSVFVRKLVGPFQVPNAFTPNADGINDRFVISGLSDVGEFRLTIFNRWGQRVFISQNDRRGWDGINNGQVCPPGTYVYTLSFYKEGMLQTRKGAFELIR